MNIFVVIPAHNEAGRIRQVVESLLPHFSNIIVVNDGSTDNTKEAIAGLPIYYCEHALNLGQGAGLKTGTELAWDSGAEAVIHCDADGQHRVEDVIQVGRRLRESKHDVVLGSRFLDKKTEMPFKKKVILLLAKWFSRAVLRLEITDPQSGLRGFTRDAWPKIQFIADDFRHCTEILSLIKKNNASFIEIPIKVKYDQTIPKKDVRPQMRMGLQILWDRLFK